MDKLKHFEFNRVNSPQIMSRVVFVINGQIFIDFPTFPVLYNWSIRIVEFSAKISLKSSRILEWKAGVRSRRWVNQCWPNEYNNEKKVTNSWSQKGV